MLESALAAGMAEAGGDVFLGGVLPTPAAAILVRRHGFDLGGGRLRLAQPLARQRDQVLRPDGRKLDDERRGRDRGTASPRGRPPAAPRAGSASSRARSTTTCGRCDGVSRSTSPGAGSSSTAPTAPPTGPRRRSSSGSAPTSRSPPSPTGATSTRAAARPISRASPRAWPSSGAEVGFAFDGDGDRMLAVDGEGASSRRRRADRADRHAPRATPASCAAASR